MIKMFSLNISLLVLARLKIRPLTLPPGPSALPSPTGGGPLTHVVLLPSAYFYCRCCRHRVSTPRAAQDVYPVVLYMINLL